MTGREPWPPMAEFDVLGTAVVCAVIAGALSLLAPFLFALTATLVALALAGWCSGLGRTGNPVRALGRPYRILAVSVLVLATVLALASPWSIGAFRGLVLGLGTVPLWWFDRHRPAGRGRGGES